MRSPLTMHLTFCINEFFIGCCFFIFQNLHVPLFQVPFMLPQKILLPFAFPRVSSLFIMHALASISVILEAP